MPKNCRARSEITAPTTPIQLRATWVPVRTEALLNDGSSGEYDASARKRRSAETHNRNPISSFSRRLPVGTNMLARRRIYGPSLHGTRNRPVAANRPEPHHYAKNRTRRQWRNLAGVYSWITRRGSHCLLKMPQIRQRDHDHANDYAVNDEHAQSIRLQVAN